MEHFPILWAKDIIISILIFGCDQTNLLRLRLHNFLFLLHINWPHLCLDRKFLSSPFVIYQNVCEHLLSIHTGTIYLSLPEKLSSLNLTLTQATPVRVLFSNQASGWINLISKVWGSCSVESDTLTIWSLLHWFNISPGRLIVPGKCSQERVLQQIASFQSIPLVR